MKRSFVVAVGGAGVGGLAAATRLARLGHRVTVFDKASAPAPVGSGLVVQPVGLAALEDIGLADRLRALGRPIERLLGKTQPSGATVLDARYRKGAYGLAVQRAALFDLLLDAAKAAGVEIRHGEEVTAVAARSGRPRVSLVGGEIVEADLVVDALGARSVLSPSPGRPLDYGALWATLRWPEDPPLPPTRLEQRYRKASQMTGLLPVGRTETDPTDRVAYFWSLRRDRIAAWRAAPIEDWRRQALALWPESAPVVNQVESHADFTPAVYRHRTLARPVDGRLVHLGDSWHATSPQLGQGANMALLDAAALGAALRETADLDDALRDYAARRRWHIAVYQLASRLFTPVYQSDSAVLPVIRDRLVAPLISVWPASRVISALVEGGVARPLLHAGLDHRGSPSAARRPKLR
ncbi:MAG: NAD(P)/FAD-dependent oxidoreductase [Pseudomonadota bacterium]